MITNENSEILWRTPKKMKRRTNLKKLSFKNWWQKYKTVTECKKRQGEKSVYETVERGKR